MTSGISSTWNYTQRQTCSIRPQNISPFKTQKLPQSAEARMYLKGQVSEVWHAIRKSLASKNALYTFIRNLIAPSNAKKMDQMDTHTTHHKQISS